MAKIVNSGSGCDLRYTALCFVGIDQPQPEALDKRRELRRRLQFDDPMVVRE